MKRNKSGISLIVLVITIIVMIILAAAVVIALDNSGIINKANEAVDSNNIQQVQQLASLIWAEGYLDEISMDADYIKQELTEQGINTDAYDIVVEDNGVAVNKKVTPKALGSLIKSAADYGKEINYVSDNGVTDWKVFYHTEDYVYLIESSPLAQDKVSTALSGENINAVIGGRSLRISDQETRTTACVYWTEMPAGVSLAADVEDKWMAKFLNNTSIPCTKIISYFLDETLWNSLKNSTATYKDYVLGAIGTPTLEMLAASWNAKRDAINNTEIYNIRLDLTNMGSGYYINNYTDATISYTDSLYAGTTIWLATPCANDNYYLATLSGNGYIYGSYYYDDYPAIRPVVCLSADIPAVATENGYEI